MDKELEALSRRTPPAASPEARARAMVAAMAAFDEADNHSDATQGSARGRRQSSIVNRLWSLAMNRKFLAGSALATLLVIPAAGYISFDLFRAGLMGQPVAVEEADGRAADEKTENGAIAGRQDAAGPTVTADGALTGETAPIPVTKPLVMEKAASPDQDALSRSQVAAMPAEAESSMMVDQGHAGGAARLSSRSTTAESKVGEIAGDDVRYLLNRTDARERYAHAEPGPVKSVATDPVSTFSADVDTASYALVRKSLMSGALPDPKSVRVEEMINYFPYDWPGPKSAAEPFKATVTLTPTPWNRDTRLMHVAIKGYDIVPTQTPRANLVFLIDVSGSMDEPDKLPLLKSAFRLLVDRLKPEDTVSIVTYAGNAGTVLQPTAAKDRAAILSAIDDLQPGGSTAGAEGIAAAYALAQSAFVQGGVNRVMLATDGDFNVGPSSDADLKAMIEDRRKSGIFLSVLGFGRGNLNDSMMQVLAQNGNGTAAYIDTLAEAQKTLVEEAGASLFPIARDVKLQVEFNPQRIAEYRLIGYETRALKREDFNNDRVDAGDIGSGHRVTAIYEITPTGSPAVLNEALRYGAAQKPAAAETAQPSNEIAFLKIRYKRPQEDKSNLMTTPVTEGNAVATLDAAPQDVRFSLAVAAFGQKLAGLPAVADYSFLSIAALGAGARGADAFGYRAEFVSLVRLAASLSRP